MNGNSRNSFGFDNRLQLLAIFLLAVVAVPSLTIGWKLIRRSDGATSGFDLALLEHTPFEDYLLPGIFLFVILGILSVLAGTWTFFELSWYKELVVLQGLLLMLWLTVEVAFGIYASHWHLPFIAIGLLLIVLGILMKRGKNRTT